MSQETSANQTATDTAAPIADEDLESIVPGGAQGGVVARAKGKRKESAQPAAKRTRMRVRSTFMAVEIEEDERK